jgi:hypothetical protein
MSGKPLQSQGAHAKGAGAHRRGPIRDPPAEAPQVTAAYTRGREPRASAGKPESPFCRNKASRDSS